MGLFGNPRNDQDVTMKCLFQLCDSNHDGLLTKEEIARIVHIFVLKLQIFSETRKADPKIYGERVMDIINKSFGNKAQLSEEEFRRVFLENEDIQELAQVAQSVLVTGLHVLSRPDDYESD
jgi:Ca2+-binding EF-hand superfamily protein